MIGGCFLRGARLQNNKGRFSKTSTTFKLAYVEYTIGDYAHPNRFDL